MVCDIDGTKRNDLMIRLVTVYVTKQNFLMPRVVTLMSQNGGPYSGRKDI